MATRSALLLALLVACQDGAVPQDGDTDTNSDTDTDTDTDSDTDTESHDGPELWVYASQNLQVDENRDEVIALMKRSADAGYHGFVLADFKLNLAQTDLPSEAWWANLATVLEEADALGLEVVPAVFPFGYSEGILYTSPDLAEGLPIEGAPLVADDGLLVPVGDSALDDGGFEEVDGDTFSAWDWQDEGRVVVERSAVHGGDASAHIVAGSGNARVVQTLTVEPRRQYHVRYFVRTSGWSGGTFQVIALDTTSGVSRNYDLPDVASSQDWTPYDFSFITGQSTTLSLYGGVWTESTGDLWIDDVVVEETAFHNLIRRDGAPLTLTLASGDSLTEGVDFDGAIDLQIQTAFDDWHEPPIPTTTLSGGTAVLADFYAVSPIYSYQVGACLTERGVSEWMEENLAAVVDLFPDATGFFLQYDEMRHMDTCAACRARGLTPGELLAEHVSDAIALVLASRPGATPYVWSDMFDPYHNAHDNYYLVEGDIAGSWEGLSADTVVMNWNLGDADSLAFFADRGHEQIVAGYYDSGDGYASAQAELAAGAGLVRGLMYTTWSGDFDELESYAEGARAGW